jgi:hypothetical protein
LRQWAETLNQGDAVGAMRSAATDCQESYDFAICLLLC